MKFFTGDWKKDPFLSQCSPQTRGIWIDLLCAMHDDNRSGVITGTREQFARACRCSAVEIDHAIAELKATKTADVTERDGVVTLVNRRMKREGKEREQSKLRMKKMRSTCDVTLPSQPSSEVRSQKSEVRDNKEREGAGSALPEIPPMSRADFDTLAQMRGVPKECAEWFWNTYDARGWTDNRGQQIRKVEPLLLNALVSWRSNQGPKGSPANRVELNREYERVIARIRQISEGAAADAMGTKFYRPKDKAELDKLRARRDQLRKELNILV